MSILHRWRIVTPLVLALLSLLVVTSGVASATSTHFHFFASGSVLSENSTILPNRVCDITSIPLAGANGVGNSAVSTGACHNDLDNDFTFMGNGVTNGNFANNAQFGLQLTIQFGNVTVTTSHTSARGRTNTTADAESILFQLVCKTASTVCGATSPAGATLTLLSSEQLVTSATAACQPDGKGSIAGTATSSSFPYNDLLVREGGFNGSLVHVSPVGAVNESYPISAGAGISAEFIFQEARTFHDGGIASVHVTGLHIIATTPTGLVFVNTSINTLFAAIHCAKHLSSDDTIS